jgi:NADH-quinone oxidoreductase subunit K
MENITQQIQAVPLDHYLVLSSLLFVIGVMGVLVRRNAIVNLLLAAFSAYRGDPAGQIFVFFIMAVAAAEVAVGLAIIVMIYRNTRSIDVNFLNRLKG